ncbi:Putative ribonuclease H-like superfamily, exonuclease, RNase T/DNA polymerase III [Septoria linicola]|uniref:PAN2-PAN3 deadenylation complex catalytic subunit PAN2 n=1 Tax=Septoria linicola TaxID=215465 RepID=A0A9Q9AL91_9PEZI|nr:Putative ribonuclease H-like superfamily, exonuclease, RNase T/DNA polymerase III [Septoria linicola]
MEADWTEAIRLANPSATSSTRPGRVSTFSFDTSEELLWVGSDSGKITSFFGPDLQKYTSYRAHASSTSRGASGNAPVRQILFCPKGVVSVSSRSVHFSSRRGLTQWHISLPDMVDLCCMTFTSRAATEVIVAGRQTQLYRIDVERGVVTETIAPSVSVPYTLMRLAGQHICAAAHDGSVHMLDLKTFAIVHSWKAYAGTVNDMDASGDYLLTCGWAQSQHHGLALERLVRVYDLKNRKPARPLPFQSGAAYVRLHPRLSSTCIVLSQNGTLHSIDIQNPEMPNMKFASPMDGQFIGLELMPSGKGFVLADSNNNLILWGAPTKIQFTDYAKATDFPDAVASHKALEWTNTSPLNTIGMPHYRETLLSSWPTSLIHQVGRPPPRVESIDSSFRPCDFGKVGINPRKTLRYQATDMEQQHLHDPLSAPRFLSEKLKAEKTSADTHRRMSEDLLKELDRFRVDGKAVKDARFLYRNVEIKYSRFGVEDFDFRYFNKTRYAGLETHIANSYANPLLQILRFTLVARNISLHHTARDCRLESCLMCELGFLIDMLEKASAPNCQATNFLKALSKQPDAFAQNIVESQVTSASLTTMMQNLNRFLFQRLEDNFKRVAPSLDQFHLAFGTIGLEGTQCVQCSYESRTDKVWYAHDLVYPPRQTKPRMGRQYFSQIMKASIERQSQHRGWCLRCNGYKNMVSHRAVHCLPAVLMLNAAVTTNEARQLWATPDFLPQEIGVIVNNGRFFCYEGEDLQLHLQRAQFKITVYELVGVVADVLPSDNEKSHLVATVDVGLSEADTARSRDWHLFNDFLVHQVSQEDALHFNPQWKLPSVITYQAKSMSHAVDHRWKDAIDTSILYRSPAQPALMETYRFRALSDDEMLPGSGSHVAIDAEFVRLLREEIDVGPTGKRTMTRPARSGLARVSVLRADGHDRELPFIDDYIAIDEPIDDYLTQYSGLHDGDLTAGRSRFQLVQLKDVYKKLWLLVNMGCSFIGHGLSSDLRIINIHVPEAQLIDTQELFSLGARTQRKLSLRFLAWAVLQEDIQQDAHDSIEDARTALRLWLKYLEFTDAGILEVWKDRILAAGRANNFRPPAVTSAPSTPRQAIQAVMINSDVDTPTQSSR